MSWGRVHRCDVISVIPQERHPSLDASWRRWAVGVTKALAMPADHSLRFYHDERLLPAGPDAAKCDPEEAVRVCEMGLGLLRLEHGELLPQGEVLDDELCACRGNGTQRREDEGDKGVHGIEEVGESDVYRQPNGPIVSNWSHEFYSLHPAS